MSCQFRFWRELYDLKAHANYLELHLAKAEFTDRSVNFGIAMTSASSLGMWAFLKQFEVLWAALIVLSQIATVAKNYLPYKARVKALASSVHEFEDHVVWAEGKWYDVAEGNLTEGEIVSLRSELQKRALKTMRTHFPNSVLPEDSKLLEKAISRADIYFNNFYGANENGTT